MSCITRHNIDPSIEKKNVPDEQQTPAMAAGVTDHVRTLIEMAALLTER
jgi:hypothetical protein